MNGAKNEWELTNYTFSLPQVFTMLFLNTMAGVYCMVEKVSFLFFLNEHVVIVSQI